MKQWLWCIPVLLLISPVVSAGEAKSMEELGLIEEPEKPVKVKLTPQAPKPKPQPPKVVVKTVTVEDPQTRQALAQAEAEIERLKQQNALLQQHNTSQQQTAKQLEKLREQHNDLQQQLKKKPVSDEQLMSEGMWRDPKTNMIWMRCSLGQKFEKKLFGGYTCTGIASEYNWQGAQDVVAAMNRNGGFGGYTDWMLPHIEDMASLTRCNMGFESTEKITTKHSGEVAFPEGCKYNSKRPTIDQIIFPNTSDSMYWSASPYADDDYGVWVVNFYDGYLGFHVKSLKGYVRAVRANQ